MDGGRNNYIWRRMDNNMEVSMEVYQLADMETVRVEKCDLSKMSIL